MNTTMVVPLILLMSEVTMFLIFIGFAVAGGGALMVFTANKTSSVRQSLAPNKDLLNEKKAELLEYEHKPRPSNKIVANSRQKLFDAVLENLDLDKMSEINKEKTNQYNKRMEEQKIENELIESKHEAMRNEFKVLKREQQVKNKLNKDISKIDAIINTK
ncbi:hypothetical protein [Chryseobacterium sp. 5_R23647]|uniref:hypothetical protein n=1 Tax=Chryseobacterium sp. 5_R23647 TaxID=2258964 RepID=UPI000E26E079|nr:hypothetical protein [Chryseobacterium sp. 5_R23647]REC40545.1 hypothetical protein DRF69_18220 [Chryseobacterium sp. 5_R23647]